MTSRNYEKRKPHRKSGHQTNVSVKRSNFIQVARVLWVRPLLGFSRFADPNELTMRTVSSTVAFLATETHIRMAWISPWKRPFSPKLVESRNWHFCPLKAVMTSQTYKTAVPLPFLRRHTSSSKGRPERSAYRRRMSRRSSSPSTAHRMRGTSVRLVILEVAYEPIYINGGRFMRERGITRGRGSRLREVTFGSRPRRRQTLHHRRTSGTD